MPIIVLDSHPLSLITNPANKPENRQCRNKVQQLIAHEIIVAVPEIIDYELRRTLICGKKLKGIENLDRVKQMGIAYIPITTEAMNKAAELWAWARKTGQQTAHNDKIDIDVILAAQSIIIAQHMGEHTVVVTSNVSDLQRYISAEKWENITPEYFSKLR
jgi:predicted nucleic acid-binding protein